jgi:GNAT superfamily N-acetyltransferase
MKILAGNGIPVPPPDRATLRRFRRLVADLGVDLYVAVAGEQVVGFVHVTYTRQLSVRSRARVEALAVEKEFQERGIGSSLLTFAVQRARRRGCSEVSCEAGDERGSLRTFLASCGWVRGVELLRVELPPEEPEEKSATPSTVSVATARSSDA